MFLRDVTRDDAEASRITDVVIQSPTIYWQVGGRRITQQRFDGASHDHLTIYPSMLQVIERETGASWHDLERRAQAGRIMNEVQQTMTGATSLLEGGRDEGELASGRARELGPTERVSPDWEVLTDDPAVGRLYLVLMEHYAGLTLGPDVQALSADGLTIEDLAQITDRGRSYRHMTGLIAQGLREYRSVGGSDLAHYERLQATILDQFTWGNPTATRNQLQIGRGWPEREVLGIVDRSSGMLVYDGDGMPLRSIAGGMMRDEGWVGSRPMEDFRIDISSVEDPVLRGLLNMLRHQTGEPSRMVARAAQIYLDNIDAVNAQVRQGLTGEIIEKFEDTLPSFVAFLAGHGLATLLMRSPNPTVALVGGAVKAGMVAAGWVLHIDFIGSAMERLMSAANHLVRVRQVENGQLSTLSQDHLELAAVPIRQMVSDVAMSVGLGVLSRLVRGASTIRCTRCRIKRRDARTRRRMQRSRHAAAGGQTPQQQAHQERIFGERLGRGQLADLRRAISTRPQVTSVRQRHVGRERHFQNDADPHILRTINDPQRIFVSGNGNWIFYRNGTVVITRAHHPADVMTAFGRGARLPQRHLGEYRRGDFGNAPDPSARVGSPEAPIPLSQLLDAPQMQQYGGPYPIWP